MYPKMAEDRDTGDLDYNITFPSLSPLTSKDIPLDEENVDEELLFEKEPVVILLGWAGCKDKHLVKYSAIHDHHGCITIRYTAPTDDIFYKPSNLKDTASKILELIIDMGLEDNPIFFHIFSNGGCFVYRYISELLHKNPGFRKVHVKGCIFDSGPGKKHAWTAAKALMTTLNTNIVLKYIAGILLFLYLNLTALANVFFSRMGKKSDIENPDRYWEALCEDKLGCPQLYLYSRADEIFDYTCVEEMINIRRGQGIKVASVCWDDSPHVGHFRIHREAYIYQCQQFVKTCLS